MKIFIKVLVKGLIVISLLKIRQTIDFKGQRLIKIHLDFPMILIKKIYLRKLILKNKMIKL